MANLLDVDDNNSGMFLVWISTQLNSTQFINKMAARGLNKTNKHVQIRIQKEPQHYELMRYKLRLD